MVNVGRVVIISKNVVRRLLIYNYFKLPVNY